MRRGENHEVFETRCRTGFQYQKCERQKGWEVKAVFRDRRWCGEKIFGDKKKPNARDGKKMKERAERKKEIMNKP